MKISEEPRLAGQSFTSLMDQMLVSYYQQAVGEILCENELQAEREQELSDF